MFYSNAVIVLKGNTDPSDSAQQFCTERHICMYELTYILKQHMDVSEMSNTLKCRYM